MYDLVYFSAHCVALGHSPGYIKSTMCSVGYTFETATGINPTKTMHGVTQPVLARFLLGVTKLRSNCTRPRLPMTVPLLYQFLEKLSHNIASYLVAYRAALAIAVFGMLRTKPEISSYAEQNPFPDTHTTGAAGDNYRHAVSVRSDTSTG